MMQKATGQMARVSLAVIDLRSTPVSRRRRDMAGEAAGRPDARVILTALKVPELAPKND